MSKLRENTKWSNHWRRYAICRRVTCKGYMKIDELLLPHFMFIMIATMKVCVYNQKEEYKKIVFIDNWVAFMSLAPVRKMSSVPFMGFHNIQNLVKWLLVFSYLSLWSADFLFICELKEVNTLVTFWSRKRNYLFWSN